MDINVKDILIGNTGQVFKITSCNNSNNDCYIKALSFVGDSIKEVLITKESLPFFKNITKELDSINEVYEKNNSEDSIKLIINGRILKISKKNAIEKMSKLLIDFSNRKKENSEVNMENLVYVKQ